MKNMKKLLVSAVVVLTLTATSATVFAASTYNTPAEAVAGLTNQTVEEVNNQRQKGIPYGTIADENGKLEEFQQAMQEMHKDRLSARVANGTLTQEQADAALAAQAERQLICDGTGNGMGNGYGMGNGAGRGMGNGTGYGMGNGGGCGGGMGRGWN